MDPKNKKKILMKSKNDFSQIITGKNLNYFCTGCPKSAVRGVKPR